MSFTVNTQSLRQVATDLDNLHSRVQAMISVPPEVNGRLAGPDLESAIRMFSAWLDAGMEALSGEVGDASKALNDGAQQYQDTEDKVCRSAST